MNGRRIRPTLGVAFVALLAPFALSIGPAQAAGPQLSSIDYLDAPYARGYFGATSGDAAIVFVIQANLAYAEVLQTIASSLDDDWWESLAELARSTRRVLLAHPWARPLFARPLEGPHSRALDERLRHSLRSAGFTSAEARELHDQLSNMVFALVAPELTGRRNRAAFERGLELLHAGLESRLER